MAGKISELVALDGADLAADDMTEVRDTSATTSGSKSMTTLERMKGLWRLYPTKFGVVIDGGGATITTGIKGDFVVPYACTIVGVTALADQSGSIVVDVWKDSYANFPPTDSPDSITASAPITISAATKSQDSTLTGWTTSLAAGDVLRFNVDSVSSITRVAISFDVRRTA